MKRLLVIATIIMMISTLTSVYALAETNAEQTVEPEQAETVETTEATEETAEKKEPKHGIFDPWLEAKTSIAFSSGVDKEWAYGNQQKEFSAAKSCYVRIGSAVKAIWHWGWRYGEGNEITITYRFTGTENCAVEVSDGFLTEVESNDPNVKEYTRTVKAKGSDDEDVVVFRYTPSGEGSIALEVLYDDQVNSEYDAKRTVYFVDEENW